MGALWTAWVGATCARPAGDASAAELSPADVGPAIPAAALGPDRLLATSPRGAHPGYRHYGERVKNPVAVTGILALAVVTAALAACGSSDSKVSVDKLQQIADKAKAAPTEPCPVSLDINAALKKAGVSGTAMPDPGSDDPDAHPVDAESATGVKDGSPLQSFGGGMITCTYKLSTGGYVEATLTGVRHGKAVALMAPMLSRDGEIATGDLEKVVTQKYDAGKAVLTPGAGLAAVVVLKASGGDVALEVTTETGGNSDEKNPIVGEQLHKLAEELGKQVKV